MPGAIRSAALSLLWLAAACATTSDAPPDAPSAEARTQFGAVSVVLVPEPTQYVIHPPTSGWLTGLFVGTARGLVAAPIIVLGGMAETGDLQFVPFGGVLAVGYFPFSVVNGAMTTVPRAAMEAAIPAFRSAFEDPSLPDLLRAEFSRRAESHLGGGLVSMDEATTVMEIRLQAIETGTPIAVVTLDGFFDVIAMASVRVVRRADGHVVSESVATDGTPNPEDGGHQFLVWADHDAELLRHRLDEAMIGLAASLAEAVFVGAAPPPPPLFTPDEIDRMRSGQS